MVDLSAYNTVTSEWCDRGAALPAGNTATFDDLYRSQYGRLVTLARLAAGDPASVEEIVQDAFVQLYRNWSRVDFPITYVRIAVVNGCRSQGRRRLLERRHRARCAGAGRVRRGRRCSA